MRRSIKIPRATWIIGSISIVSVLLVAGVLLIILPNRDPDAKHKAAGIVHSCGTPISATTLTAYHFVSGQTTASYTVHENVIGVNPNNIVVGKTSSVTGTFFIHDGATPLVTGADILVDLTTLQTDSSVRDKDVRDGYLETYEYPNATFSSTCAQGLPATYSAGESVAFHLIGNLTMHGQTNAEDFAVQGQLNGKTITGMATTTMYMTDFGITPPNELNITIVENKVVLTVAFTAQAQA